MLVPAELTAAIKSPGSQQELHSQQCNGLAWGEEDTKRSQSWASHWDHLEEVERQEFHIEAMEWRRVLPSCFPSATKAKEEQVPDLLRIPDPTGSP